MAKDRKTENPVEHLSDSSEEEEEEVSSEETDSEESESEPEQTQVAIKPSTSASVTFKKPLVEPSSKPQPQQARPVSSSDEEESGSESDSDSDQPNINVKPLASKPMDEPRVLSAGSKNPRSKSNSVELGTPVKSSASKRPAQGNEMEVKDAKKLKKKAEAAESSEKKSNDDSKKVLFQRLWSEDDEIEILKGMIDYAAKKKSDPVANLSAFHDYIRKNLHVDVTRTQLQHKIRRMKKKYENNKSKEKEGKNRTFSKPHELKAYELSKKVWGNGGGKENEGEKVSESSKANGGSTKKTSLKRATVGVTEEARDAKKTSLKRATVDVTEKARDAKKTSLKRATVGVTEEATNAKTAPVASGERKSLSASTTLNPMGVSAEECILRMGVEFFEGEKGVEGEKEWKKLKNGLLEVHLKELDLKAAQAKLVLERMKLQRY